MNLCFRIGHNSTSREQNRGGQNKRLSPTV